MINEVGGFHFVVAPVGSLGDFLPAIGLAQELQHLGHKVDVVASEFFGQHVPDKLNFVGYGSAEQFKRDLADHRALDPGHPYLTEMLVAPGILPQYEAVSRAVAQSGGRVVVLTTGVGVGALWAAKCFGLCSIGLISSPPILELFRSERPPAVEGVYRAAFRATGIHPLPPATYDPERRFTGEFTIDFDYLLEMFPSWFQHVGIERAPNAIAGTFPLASTTQVEPVLSDFLAQGDAPWVFFPGSGGALLKRRPDLKQMAVDFAARAQRRVVIVHNAQETRAERLSDVVLSLRSTSMEALLPHARGLLHHGGVGGTSHGLARGLPQIVVPVSFDQPGNAAWIEAAGVGLACSPEELNVDRLCSMVAAVETLPRDVHQLYAQRLDAEGGARGLAERLLGQIASLVPQISEAAV